MLKSTWKPFPWWKWRSGTPPNILKRKMQRHQEYQLVLGIRAHLVPKLCLEKTKDIKGREVGSKSISYWDIIFTIISAIAISVYIYVDIIISAKFGPGWSRSQLLRVCNVNSESLVGTRNPQFVDVKAISDMMLSYTVYHDCKLLTCQYLQKGPFQVANELPQTVFWLCSNKGWAGKLKWDPRGLLNLDITLLSHVESKSQLNDLRSAKMKGRRTTGDAVA